MTVTIIIAAAALLALWAVVVFRRHARDEVERGEHYAGQVHQDKDGTYHAQCICGWDHHAWSLDGAITTLMEHSGADGIIGGE